VGPDDLARASVALSVATLFLAIAGAPELAVVVGAASTIDALYPTYVDCRSGDWAACGIDTAGALLDLAALRAAEGGYLESALTGASLGLDIGGLPPPPSGDGGQ
jgi:hypothetical protein